MRTERMSQSARYITMGKFGKPFGVKGWIKVTSYTDPIEQLLNYQPWHYQQHSQIAWQALEIDANKVQGKGLLIHIKGCDSPEQVKSYTNGLIAIERDKLPTLVVGEYYWCDLEGLTVINQQGETLGIIDYLFTTASNDVIVVKGEQLYYIPYIQDDFVIEIDLAAGQMIVAWES
ncbi:MAG: ribosome maturation factor RimM [Gammaproteobacteria bacterium]|nr:ribosome maturation factor RimM [Gammaproteobacteria bacterium]